MSSLPTSGSGGESGGNLLTASLGNLKELQASVLGEDYDYAAKIRNPMAIGMSSEGTIGALAADIGGLIAYVKLLVEGGGKAQTISGPLGNKFFVETAAKCKDVATDKEVVRSIYVNHQPDGTIPFMPAGMNGASFKAFRGLVPGVVGNIGQINPMQILQAFMSDGVPKCRKVAMQIINNNNQYSTEEKYLTDLDITNMSPCWFPGGRNPITKLGCTQGFSTMKDEEGGEEEGKNIKTFSAQMPKDFMVQLYYTSLGLLGLYILFKMFRKKRNNV